MMVGFVVSRMTKVAVAGVDGFPHPSRAMNCTVAMLLQPLVKFGGTKLLETVAVEQESAPTAPALFANQEVKAPGAFGPHSAESEVGTVEKVGGVLSVIRKEAVVDTDNAGVHVCAAVKVTVTGVPQEAGGLTGALLVQTTDPQLSVATAPPWLVTQAL